MKHCLRCGAGFEAALDRCPIDGEILHENTTPLSVEVREVPEDTGALALEIEDLIFRVCSTCHSSFGGLLDVCPNDGTRLSEHSMLTRNTMLHGSEAWTEGVFQLKKYCTSCNKHFALHLKACPECGSALIVPTLGGPKERGSSPAEAGQLIAEKYRLIQDIGAGGFGSVYLAKHESLGKRYAIKMLRAQISDRISFRNRFHEEALKVSRLEDENIVKVIDFGEWQDCQYMVTEFVEGQDLGEIIYGEKATPIRAARIMKQVAGALQEAHAKKIVHLDLKPPNILVSQKRGQDLVKVIDFGIAEIYSENRESRQERVCGTCTYMAPEQWRRQPLDPRTDIYSFGVIFYEFLAGRPPFRHSSVSALEKAHCRQPSEPLKKLRPDIPVEIEKLVHRCLEKDPTKRIQSAGDLEAALGAYLRRTENAHAVRLRLLWLAAGIVAILAAGGWAFWEGRRDKEPPDWVAFDAKGDGLMDCGIIGNTRTYETRESDVDVVVSLEARDNRGIARLKIGSGNGEEATIPGGEGEHTFKLNDPVTLTLEALDHSGLSAKAFLTFERLPPATVKTNLYQLREFTNQETVELVITELEGGTAHVSCTHGAEAPFEIEVEKASRVPISLRRGQNTIAVRLRDLGTGQLDEGNRHTVDQNLSPLSLKAAVRTREGKVLAMESPGTWLSSQPEIELLLKMEDAPGRLREGTEIPYRRNKESLREKWDRDEIAGKLKTVRVLLQKEGPNVITIEPLEDRYGNRSEEKSLVVDLDRSPPKLTLPSSTVEYYAEDLPSLRFMVQDSSGDPEAKDFDVLETASGKPLDRGLLRFAAGSQGWDLTFLDSSPLRGDGIHKFRILARDRVGNETRDDAGRFTVLSDHTPPQIEILSPSVERHFRRKDSIDLKVRVTDAFQVDLTVEAVVPLSSPARTHELRAGGVDLWETSIKLGSEGVEKPGTFETLEPGFRITFIARDRAGHQFSKFLDLRFDWENGDRLYWKPSDSTLVYHAKARSVPPFWLESTEVSNRQYARFLEEQGGKAPRSPDWHGGTCSPERLDFPVVGISWIEVKAYAGWAGLKTARKKEWLVGAFWDVDETDNRSYPWKGGWPPKGWTPNPGGKRPLVPVRALSGLGAVGTPLGLLHMWGNVWELVLDESTNKPVRVGGGFDTRDEVYRQVETYREYLRGEPIAPTENQKNLGFRCMLDSKGNNP